ncbi:MAG TPA: DapH/DapD/GlmU-related protein [Candidatus Binatia bacterium]|jgi:acetyltransferase-like isoleucine patch superfamily enzyme|nr:DapH/DapD/GlmU-related protein [Candidatus Binatia bacterium]
MADDPRLEHLRHLGARVGRDVFLGADVYVEADFAPLLRIEDGVVLARGVTILLHDSALNNVLGEPLKFGPVVLGERCYVGANATILCGVEVGAGAVVGAASVVTRDVPTGAVVCGNPARVQGTVRELAARHEALRTTSARFHYLPSPAWREHRDGEPAARAGERITAFVRAAAGLKEPS